MMCLACDKCVWRMCVLCVTHISIYTSFCFLKQSAEGGVRGVGAGLG